MPRRCKPQTTPLKKVALKQIVVSVRRTTKLTLVVPEGMVEDVLCHAVELGWDGDRHFFNARGHVMPDSQCLIADSEGVENEALVEEPAEPYEGDVSAHQVLAVWCALSDHDGLQELAAQANELREKELAA